MAHGRAPADVAAALERFTEDAIGRMVVICAVLKHATDPES
jgi:hypothetical protein